MNKLVLIAIGLSAGAFVASVFDEEQAVACDPAAPKVVYVTSTSGSASEIAFWDTMNGQPFSEHAGATSSSGSLRGPIEIVVERSQP